MQTRLTALMSCVTGRQQAWQPGLFETRKQAEFKSLKSLVRAGRLMWIRWRFEGVVRPSMLLI